MDAALDQLAREWGEPATLVFAGFSQGVAMAYRAALLGRREARALLAVGGDVPPELRTAPSRSWPPIVMCAGTGGTLYGPARMEQDAEALRALGAEVRAVTFPGGHEWTPDVDRAAGEALARLR